MEQTTNISATRMERLRQAERLKTTKRAHQLLEDKYDEMVHKFTVLIKNNHSLRELVENKLNQILQLFIASSTRMTSEAIDTALDAYRSEITLTCSSQNIMGLSIPHVEIESVSTPSNSILLSTPTNFDEAITLLRQLNATIIELANIEK
ncbi:MAG: hypothetical protein MJ054_01285, partial [Clostridia bacterium]|nr:hypothetical protein [Clostridia bacterium]